MVDVVRTLMVCTDCQHYVAFGGLPDDDVGELEARIDAHLNLSYAQSLCEGDSANDEEFSWNRCECCGSRLGGARHEMWVID